MYCCSCLVENQHACNELSQHIATYMVHSLAGWVASQAIRHIIGGRASNQQCGCSNSIISHKREGTANFGILDWPVGYCRKYIITNLDQTHLNNNMLMI